LDKGNYQECFCVLDLLWCWAWRGVGAIRRSLFCWEPDMLQTYL
jgi:hypothetical protein